MHYALIAMPLHQRVEWKLEGDGVARATDAAVSTVPAFQFVLFDDLGRFAFALIDLQDVGRTIADAFTAADTLGVVKNRRHSLTPFR
jgi:hypothetical protein